MNYQIFVTAVVALLMITGADAIGQDQQPAAQAQSQSDEAMYGWQMMDEQERRSYRDQMESLKTEGERHQFRLSHREKMQARASEQGVSIAQQQSRRGGESSKGGKGGGRSQSNRPAFADFDANGDGYLEAGEYARGHAERIAERAKEGRAMRNVGSTTFADIDTDGDGRANPSEFAAHQAKQHQANQQRKQGN